MMTLSDLGEDAIVNQLILQYLGGRESEAIIVGVGDDAAVLRIERSSPDVVVTVDACPTPVVELLGLGTMYDWGRLAGVISLSDLASMGADSVGLLSSTIMPPSMKTVDYQEFLKGLSDVCSEWSTPIIGGNIREGENFSATTVALGTCSRGRAFRRNGARVGDGLVVVGNAGLFWSAVLDLLVCGRLERLSASQKKALFRPTPRLAESVLLRELGVVNAAVDCSDGLGSAIETLGTASRLGAVLEIDEFQFDPRVSLAAEAHDVRLERLLLAWGDWQLVVAVPSSEARDVVAEMQSHGYPAFVAGWLTETPGIEAVRRGAQDPFNVTDVMASKHFDATYYPTHGLQAYVSRLKAQWVQVRQ